MVADAEFARQDFQVDHHPSDIRDDFLAAQRPRNLPLHTEFVKPGEQLSTFCPNDLVAISMA
ncbi:hypothetical protein [Paraburkholderia domus]|uniref:hypothetical protein n=1 Tax=Paraburkholderia domus TaxID=2793075 RepID=UPI0019125F8D|nr:hypothetical protein [Paraburkholderia domus]MBK5169366.1 hypothetical protein [Burkholderia sp. R-70211]